MIINYIQFMFIFFPIKKELQIDVYIIPRNTGENQCFTDFCRICVTSI